MISLRWGSSLLSSTLQQSKIAPKEIFEKI